MISISYLALTPTRAILDQPGARWRSWYDFFPWEDWREGRPSLIDRVIAPALKKDIRDLKIWIESEDSIYGSSIAQGQKRILETFGAKVVGVGSHSARSIDLNDTVLRIKQTSPDVLIQTGYVPDGNLLLRTLRDQGVKPSAILFVGTGDTPETLQALGDKYIEGILVVGYPRNDISETYGPGNKAYLEAYRAKYKADPVAPQGMNAYSGFMMLAETLKAAGGVEPDKVQAAAAKMDKPENSYPSGHGMKFDKNFQNVRAGFTVSQWQGGAITGGVILLLLLVVVLILVLG